MKIGIAQINFIIGNFEENSKKIISAIEIAKEQEVDLILFSELSVSGYPPLDLLEREEFIAKSHETIVNIAKHCDSIAAVVGGAVKNPSTEGKNLFNAGFFLYEGKIQHVIHKSLLPTYDIFDEYRYFEPNKEFEIISFKGKNLALTICEDLWDQQEFESDFGKTQLYTISPMEELTKLNPDVILNIAASPYSYLRETVKKQIFIGKAMKYKLPVFYVNQIGGQAELIFEGGSMVINSEGKVFDELSLFEEEIRFYDLDDVLHKEPLGEDKVEPMIIENIHNALKLGIRDFFRKLNFSKATLGLSGGIDSAVSLVLAVRALGAKNIKVLLLPSKYSTDHSISDSEELARNLGVEYEIVRINDIVDSFNSALDSIFKNLPDDVTEENIQARVRAVLLMALSNKLGYILLNTSNKSEAAVGYGTLYGDMAGGLSVLGDVYKTDVYNLAKYINQDKNIIPCNIINKAPSAELKPDQKDSDSLPDYSVLDQILYRYLELQRSKITIIQDGFDADLVERIIQLINESEYKRYQAPPILRISSKSFGLGRRMPLVANYQFL
ncbi:MAG: NAD+ synthase [Bacteroidales bacterium]|nr:NAD+ synthase [Bacteroidales bacterium]